MKPSGRNCWGLAWASSRPECLLGLWSSPVGQSKIDPQTSQKEFVCWFNQEKDAGAIILQVCLLLFVFLPWLFLFCSCSVTVAAYGLLFPIRLWASFTMLQTEVLYLFTAQVQHRKWPYKLLHPASLTLGITCRSEKIVPFQLSNLCASLAWLHSQPAKVSN